MTKRIAKRGDTIQGTCLHLCHAPGGGPPAPTTLPFHASIHARLSPTVFADGQAVALLASAGENAPRHAPPPVLGRQEVGTILLVANRTVLVNGGPVGADGDAAMTCDEKGAPGRVVAGACTVLVGS